MRAVVREVPVLGTVRRAVEPPALERRGQGSVQLLSAPVAPTAAKLRFQSPHQ
jgi:hypothetical protein